MGWNNITVRFIFITLVLCHLFALGLTYQLGQLYNKDQAKKVQAFIDFLHNEQDEFESLTRRALDLKAQFTISMLTDIAGELISNFDIPSLEKIAEYAAKDKDVCHIYFYDKEMKPFLEQKCVEKGVEFFKEKIVYENTHIGFIEVGIKFSALKEHQVLLDNQTGNLISNLKKDLFDSKNKVQYIIVAFSVLISVLLCLTVFLLLRLMVIRPVKKLIEFAGRLRQGDFSSRLPPQNNDEIGDVVEAFNELAGALQATTVTTDTIEKIFNSITDIIITVSSGGIISNANKTAYDLLGYSKEELINSNIDMLFADKEENRSLKDIISGEKKDQVQSRFLTKSGNTVIVLLGFSKIKDSEKFLCIAKDMTEINRITEELKDLSEYLNKIIDSSPDGITVSDNTSKILRANDSYGRILGKESLDEIVGKSVNDITVVGPGTYECTTGEIITIGDDYINDARKALELLFDKGSITAWESYIPLKDNKILPTEMSISLLYDHQGEYMGAVGITRDITSRKKLEVERANIQSQLLQAEKLASVGQLAAGIAHEINTPTQYIGDNIHFLKESFEDLNIMIEKYEALTDAVKNGKVTDSLLKEIKDTAEKIDLEYITEEIPSAVDQSLAGTKQISRIVLAMRDFSHPGSKDKEPFDINKAILSVITVSRNEWKSFAEVVTELSPDLPLVPCIGGECNQVFLNMIINASHAIKDLPEDGSAVKGTITISTRTEGEYAEVHIRDTGTGIPKESRSKIFDPFYTTKEVGKGTGQGLAIAYSLITEKHGGSITFETEMGKGTEFVIRLPLDTMK